MDVTIPEAFRNYFLMKLKKQLLGKKTELNISWLAEAA